MLMTAETHNDILDKKTLGREKNTYKKTNPNTDDEASAHHFRIGDWKRQKLGWGYGWTHSLAH